jgi:hypothetical protein
MDRLLGMDLFNFMPRAEQKLGGFIFGVLGLYIMPFYKSPFQQRGTNLRLASINFLV